MWALKKRKTVIQGNTVENLVLKRVVALNFIYLIQ